MKIFFLLLFSLPFLLSAADSRKGGNTPPSRKIQFERALKKGDFFSCFVRIGRVQEYSLALPGAGAPIERKDVIELSLTGLLHIREVNEKGQTKKFSLHIASVTGACNGMEIDSNLWRGQELSGEFSASAAGGTLFQCPGLKRPLKREEEQLFRALFPGGGANSLSALTSPSLTLREKEKFPLQLDPLLRSLAARKIANNKEALAGEGEYLGRSSFRGIPCDKFKFRIISRKVPGYDLKYQAEILLPADPAAGSSLQIYRNAREFINKIISSSNQFAAGARLSQLVTEEASITLLPESDPHLPGKKKEETGGFHQLLKPRK